MYLNFPKYWNITLRIILFSFIYTITIPSLQAQQKKIDSLLQIINSNSIKETSSVNDTVYINSLIELGKSYRYVNSDTVIVIATKTLDLSIESEYNSGIIDSYYLHANFYSDNGKSESAIRNYRKALSFITDKQYRNKELELLNSLASEYIYLGDYSKALSGYLKGIDLASEVDNKKLLSMMNENIASLYSSQKEYEQALEFYDKVTAINAKIGDELFSAETYSNIAQIYSKSKRFDYAMFNVNKAISIFEKNKKLNWLSHSYRVKGEIYLDQENYKWAVYWFKQSEQIHEKIDSERLKINLFNGISKAYYGLKDDHLAMKYANKGYTIASTLNSIQGQKECANTLYLIHKRNNDFSISLYYHEIHKTLSDSLTRNDNKKGLSLLKAKTDYQKEKELLIETNEKALAKQRKIIYLSLVALLILGVIIFIVIRSQRIQKRLNKKLNLKTNLIRKRESELKELNKTKNKLFSIIGHDLRGPIGALQELLRLFSLGEIKKDELISFVPKLKSDVDNVLFTLNNLLYWGQSQMNGSSTKPKTFSITNLINRNMKLLSEMANNKSIQIRNHIAEHSMVFADQNQIDIVVRNLISNAIKFTPENGLISIYGIEKEEYWEIQIQDTGVGISKDIQDKIFLNSATVTTYGTNHEKGTGLGLSLCKEMIEKNNGKIWVNSDIHIGATFSFTILKGKVINKVAS